MKPRSTGLRGLACAAAVVVAVGSGGCGGSGAGGASSAASGGDDGGGGSVKVGFVTALSGQGSINSVGNLDGLELAVKELNGDERLGGHTIATVTGDDTTDPGTAAQVCQRFVTQDHVQAIVGNEISAGALACQQIAETAQIPYISAAVGSTEICKDNYFTTNQSPKQAVLPGLGYLLQEKKARRVYLIGSDYASPKASFAVARPVIEQAGGKVVGTGLYPLGTSDFSVALSKIRAAHPDAIVSAEVAADNIAFHKALGNDPQLSQLPELDFVMKPQDAQKLGDAVDGVYAATLYDPLLPGAANERYKKALAAVGGDQPYGGFYVYTAMHMLGDAIAGAVEAGGDVDGAALIRHLPSATFAGAPIGSLAMERHYLKAPVTIVQYRAGGPERIVHREPSVDPGVSCPAG